MTIGPGGKGEALLTALQFSAALNSDSVGVAGCTVAKVIGEEDYRSTVVPALRSRILEPKLAPGEEIRCAIWHFQEEGKTRLYIENFVQIRRESNHVLPYLERLAFEVRIQVLRGKGYREWHEILVRPLGFERMPDGNHKVASWRVIRYEVTGWQYMHEHSSSSGPIR